MSGGGTILTGLALLLAFLVGLTRWHMGYGLKVLLLGGIPLVLLVVGVVAVWMGIMDLRAKKAETSK